MFEKIKFLEKMNEKLTKEIEINEMCDKDKIIEKKKFDKQYSDSMNFYQEKFLN